VRFRRDGNLEDLGRADTQIKLRGHRIELGEIENAILQNAMVRDAIVVVREDTPGDRILAAYLIAREFPAVGHLFGRNAGHESLIGRLREQLREKLPTYMVPSAFKVMERFPLTPNGKLDRAALPPPDRAWLSAAWVAPQSDSEIGVAALWSELLKRDRVGLFDNFFELGGHSLLVAQMAARLAEEFDTAITLKECYEHATVRELAVCIDRLRELGSFDAQAIERLSDDEVTALLGELDQIESA
jgi:hypothetical protein